MVNEYKKEYNEDLICKLPELFFDEGGYKLTHLKFWRIITKLLSENYTKKIYDWCDERALKFTGHMVMDPNTIKGVCGFNGIECPGAVYVF